MTSSMMAIVFTYYLGRICWKKQQQSPRQMCVAGICMSL